MRREFGLLVLAATAALLTGCGKEEAAPTLQQSMAEVMEPQAETIWDITSHAYNDVGDGLVPSKITAKDWADIATAAGAIRDRALLLEATKRILVVEPGKEIMGGHAAGEKGDIGPAWEAANAKIVQDRIDKDPALFAKHARTVAEVASTIAQSAVTRDTKALYTATADLDEACDGCHEPFWGTDVPPPFPHE